MPGARVSAFRTAPESPQVAADLRQLDALAGTWKGRGYNLIARPNFHDSANLYLQLNQTRETLKVEPLGSPIPNRGFGQDDITLFGMNYLQKITDAGHDGALHFEPGLWVTQAPTAYPPEIPPSGAQIVCRMGSVPHGNALLAQGIAEQFAGPPTLTTGAAQYAFSRFPSFNSTPVVVPPAGPPIMNAAGTSDKQLAINIGIPAPFPVYDMTNAAGPGNPRTPYDTSPPEPQLPQFIDGVAIQTVVNDPITLLQKTVQDQVDDGCTFAGTVINISTENALVFFKNANSKPGSPTVSVNLGDFNGGIENTLFLEGGNPTGAQGSNALTAQIYATFWISTVSHPNRRDFMQLQYAQMVVLNFPLFSALHPPPPAAGAVINVGWPHISVATLRKSFE